MCENWPEWRNLKHISTVRVCKFILNFAILQLIIIPCWNDEFESMHAFYQNEHEKHKQIWEMDAKQHGFQFKDVKRVLAKLVEY